MNIKMISLLPSDPYRGINSFRYVDRTIYSGRETEVEKLYKMILQFRGLLIFGNSGVGKSSIISAGLIPYLFEQRLNVNDKQHIFVPEVIRLNTDASGAFVVSRIKNSDEENTFENSLFDHFVKGDEAKINISIEDFQGTLSAIQECEPSDEQIRTHVLIFDQFEELITLFEESTIASPKAFKQRIELQEQIINLIASNYFDKNLPLKFVFVFREDYLARFGKLFNLIPDLKDHYLRVKPIPTFAVKHIITKPFDTEEKRNKYVHHFSDILIGTLIAKIKERYPDDNLNLTEVQIICYQLYNKKSQGENEQDLANENINSLLENYYLGLITKVQKDDQRLAIDLLALLVMNDSTRNVVHKNALHINLKKYGQQKIDAVIKILEEDVRVIRKENRQGGIYFEIVSEAIIPFINKIKVEKEQQHISARQNRKALIAFAASLLAFAAIVLYMTYWNTTISTYKNWNEDKKVLSASTLRDYGTYPAYKDALEFYNILNRVNYISFKLGEARTLKEGVEARLRDSFNQEPFYEKIDYPGQCSADGRYFLEKGMSGDTLKLYDRQSKIWILKNLSCANTERGNSVIRASRIFDLRKKLCVVSCGETLSFYYYEDHGSTFLETKEENRQSLPLFSLDEQNILNYIPINYESTLSLKNILNYKLESLNEKKLITVSMGPGERFLNAIMDSNSRTILYSENSQRRRPINASDFFENIHRQLIKRVYSDGRLVEKVILAEKQLSVFSFDEELNSRRFVFYNGDNEKQWRCYDLSKDISSNDFISIPNTVSNPIELLINLKDTVCLGDDGLILLKKVGGWATLTDLKTHLAQANSDSLYYSPIIATKAGFLGDSSEFYVIAPPNLAHYSLASNAFHYFTGQDISDRNTAIFKASAASIAIIQRSGPSFVWYLRNEVDKQKIKSWMPGPLPYPLRSATSSISGGRQIPK